MNDELAHKTLAGVLATIDDWGDHERRWGYGHGAVHIDALAQPLKEGIDEVRARTKLARDVVAAMGEDELAARSNTTKRACKGDTRSPKPATQLSKGKRLEEAHTATH